MTQSKNAWLALVGMCVAAACGGSSVNNAGGSGTGADGGANEDSGSSGGLGGDSGGGAVDSGSTGEGGGDSGLLPAGAACTANEQCASLGCDYTSHCSIGRSCTAHNGGDTCGPNANESCCTTIDVPKPTTPFKLDKYNITSGRFRTFITETGGNVRAYVQANRPTWFETVWDAWLPIEMDDGTYVDAINVGIFQPGQGQDGVYQQLGPIHYGQKVAGGNEGCATSEVGNARTYRLADAVNTEFNDAQQYTQDILDQKPQQCTTFFMFAAFCIWDGGRLASLDELDYAWDEGDPTNPDHLYPWGASPAPGGWDNAYPFNPAGQGFGTPAPAGSDMTVANYKYNFWMPDTIQCVNGDAAHCDYSVYIAPPGRYPKGNGPYGHADLAGNVYDVSMPMDGTAGTDPTTRNVGLNRTGAFDIHTIPAQHPITGFQELAIDEQVSRGGRALFSVNQGPGPKVNGRSLRSRKRLIFRVIIRHEHC